jgi:hypothetical protein
MARIKPDFGSRHHRPSPQENLGDLPRTLRHRIDWKLTALVVMVFVAGFLWLF